MVTRRTFITGTALGSLSFLARPVGAPAFAGEPVAAPALGGRQAGRAAYTFTQFHNQPATSSLHRRLVGMWAAIETETNGRVHTQVFPQNNNIPGSDPAALDMLVAGEIEFFTLMGGIIGNVVPVAEVQSIPFAFRSAAHAHRAMDGPLGAYLREEMAAKGIVGFPVGAFDNGMRQIAGTKRRIVVPDDLIGIRMRVPAAQIFSDTFRALGAEPVTINSADILDAVRADRIDAQENPLALMDFFGIYDLVKYVSLSNHMWSGFNMLANQSAWTRLPDDIRTVIERNVTTSVRLQRADQNATNVRLRAELPGRGLIVDEIDPAPFRRQLSGVYAAWKQKLGSRCWSLLEAESGVLA